MQSPSSFPLFGLTTTLQPCSLFLSLSLSVSPRPSAEPHNVRSCRPCPRPRPCRAVPCAAGPGGAVPLDAAQSGVEREDGSDVLPLLLACRVRRRATAAAGRRGTHKQPGSTTTHPLLSCWGEQPNNTCRYCIVEELQKGSTHESVPAP